MSVGWHLPDALWLLSALHAGGLIPIYDVRSGKPELKAIAADGNTKLSHYAASGDKNPGLRYCSAFYGDAHERVAACALYGEDFGVGAAFPDADIGASACDSHLTCARQTARASSIIDVHGVLAYVCPHGQPARGVLMDMHTPEQFRCADTISLLCSNQHEACGQYHRRPVSVACLTNFCRCNGQSA